MSNSTNAKETKDELSDILGSHFNLESIPNINSKDVEDIFKGVLTDESQESQESNAYPIQTSNVFGNNSVQTVQHPVTGPVRPNTLPNVNQSSINSPMSFPPQSPYHSEYSKYERNFYYIMIKFNRFFLAAVRSSVRHSRSRPVRGSLLPTAGIWTVLVRLFHPRTISAHLRK